ncbi:trigger factor [Candidatus Dependentiae bacterium]|nr:trigger factor [Candidatus Dependentiae bacterium]
MNYKIEEINQSEKKIIFTVDQEKIQGAITSELKSIKKQSKIPGYRPGKAPLSRVKNLYYHHALIDAQEQIIKEGIGLLIDENKELKIISTPEVIEIKMNDDESMNFTLRIELFPDVDVTDYKAISVTKTKREVTEDDIQASIQMLKDRESKLEEKGDEPIIEGDYINLDFQVLEDKKVVDEVKNYSFYVNSLKDIPGFEEGLIGMKQGEEKEINVKYPDDYIREELREKEVIYNVKVNKVEKKIVPEINDEFVKTKLAGQGLNNYEEFLADIKKRLIENNKKLQNDEMLKQIYDFLIEKNAFELPTNFLKDSMERYKEDKVKELSMYGYKKEDVLANLKDEDVKKDVTLILKKEIIKESILKKEKIEVSDDEVNKKIDETLGPLNQNLDEKGGEQMKKYRHQLSHRYHEMLQNEKVDKFLIDNAKIKEIMPEKKDSEAADKIKKTS